MPTDTELVEDAEELRRRLEVIEGRLGAPRYPQAPPVDPKSWAGIQAATQDLKRQERVAAAQAERDRLQREADEADEAERVRQEENAPKIAALRSEIAALREQAEPLERALEPILAAVSERRRQIGGLQ
jgi:chromosome segregation ATPase